MELCAGIAMQLPWYILIQSYELKTELFNKAYH